jgi:uncharacterized protein (TIGR03437 family)
MRSLRTMVGGRCPRFAIALLLTGVRIASAQCYTFSSGSAASFTVNITSLPSPTMPSPGIYQYSSDSGLAGTASLTVDQTTYTSSPSQPISLIVTVSSDSSIDFSAFDLTVGFTSTNNTIVAASVSLGWSGIFFPNGSLPAALPPIPGSVDPFMVLDVNFAETDYTPDSVSGCSAIVSPPPPPTLPVPSIKAGGIVPVGSAVSTIQSGEWVSIYGANLANSTMAWNGDFPTFLGGTSVTVNGKSAYLSFVSAGQINVQAPTDTATGNVPVVVTTAGGSSTATVTLARFAPSFFLQDSKHVAGIIVRADGSGAYGGGSYDIIGPTGTSLGYPTVAAKAGDIVELYSTGLGLTNPAAPAGQVFFGTAPTTNPVRLRIGNSSVLPTFAGLSGAGLYQINLTVPEGLGTGDVSIVATVGGTQTPPNVVISLQ